jgi:hypothetical protein
MRLYITSIQYNGKPGQRKNPPVDGKSPAFHKVWRTSPEPIGVAVSLSRRDDECTFF